MLTRFAGGSKDLISH